MENAITSGSLITVDEANEVVGAPTGRWQQFRTPMLIVLGALLVVVAALLILMLLSFRNSQTGWESVLPFLNQNPASPGLQTN